MASIENIGSNLSSVDRLKQRDRVDASSSAKVKQQGQAADLSATELRGDTAEISSAGKKLAENQGEVARFQDLLHSLINEDPDKLSAIQQRIDEGEFNRPVIQEQVADTISQLPQFQALLEESPDIPSRSQLTGSIQDRIRAGQFQTEEVLQRVAVNILNEIGAL